MQQNQYIQAPGTTQQAKKYQMNAFENLKMWVLV